MMRTLLLHLVLLVPALFVGAVEYEDYTNPAGTKFPIAIYDNVPISINRVQILSDAEQKAYFDSIRLAGFNVELWGKGDIWRKEPINKWTPYLKSLGMNTIISTRGHSLTRSKTPYDANTPDSILLEDNWDGLKTVITNYNQDPNVWGYWVTDEPGMPELHKPVFEMEPYQVAVLPTFNRVHKFRGEKVAFANMAVSYGQSYIGNFAIDNPNNSKYENYENFLDHMVDALGLKFITFDLYQVIHNEKEYGLGSGFVIKPFYYNSMDLYGRYSRDRKIPVWLVMLSVEHSSYFLDGSLYWEYPEITEGFLRMQAMNGLAFGMKGILYWQYGATGVKAPNSSYLYKSALYDINRKQKTPAWNASRYVNCEVAQYGAALLNATYDKSCLASKDPSNAFESFEKFSKEKGFECVKDIDCSEGRFLISHLTGEDGDFIAVVNQDRLNSHNVTINFDPNILNRRVKLTYWVTEINDIGIIGPAQPVEKYEDPKVKLTLSPGGMALFKYKYKK